MTEFANRMEKFRAGLNQSGIDVALITDEDNVYYLTGYHDYLHMEFGRPTILAVPKDGESALITPAIDMNTALATAHVGRISAWNDGMGKEWREHLPPILQTANNIGIEPNDMPPVVRSYLNDLAGSGRIVSVTPVIAEIRMIKSADEIELARHAGAVANAMMSAGRAAIGAGVREYEVALATSQAGTLKAAELLELHYDNSEMSPNTRFLQIMASGDTITQTHHRATTRVMHHGEPVFLCFCGMTDFRRFKLGFDRTFWIGEIADQSQVEIYELAVASQKAALNALRPGVTAESVHAAYADVIQEAGFEYPFRCGRATGFSYLEKPQLVTGDKTVLRPGMVLAVDGSVSVETFRAQVGDSFVVTEDGYEQLTDHPKSISDVII